mgnify:CR=1 FL=1
MKCHLDEIAKNTMREKGLLPDFPPEAIKEAEMATLPNFEAEDLTHLQWCSIDNDDSQDLDQLTFAEGSTAYVAIADVSATVQKNSSIDGYASYNTTSVYTPELIFTMLPRRLCYDLTSLNPQQKRLAVVVKMTFDDAMEIADYSIKLAWVINHAKLAYSKIGPMLEGKAPFNPPEFEKTLKEQHILAQKIKENRQKVGALTLDSGETRATVVDDEFVTIVKTPKNAAHELIENFMIATNSTIAKHLRSVGIPSLRRVVKVPERWDKIVEIAREKKYALPSQPDAKALDKFLRIQKEKEPITFPDLSLTIIKLMGSGEYVVEIPGEEPLGHFGLAIRNYTHSTAPNRRFPDVITQRQLVSWLKKEPNPYNLSELQELAIHCTNQEDQAQRVERHVKKSAAACLMHNEIGNTFKGIVTGASFKGTWIRLFNPPVDGKIVQNFKHLDVGDEIEVKLLAVDVEKGFIDFAKI